MAWKLGKKAKRVLAILASIFLPAIGIGLAAAIGQEIGGTVAGAAGSAIDAIIGAAVGFGTAGIIGVAYFARKKTSQQQPEAQSDDTSAPQAEVAAEPSVSPRAERGEEGRYVCNSNTHEIHDTKNLQPACNFERISEEHKTRLDTLAEVEDAIKNQGYNGCRWCMPEYDTD